MSWNEITDGIIEVSCDGDMLNGYPHLTFTVPASLDESEIEHRIVAVGWYTQHDESKSDFGDLCPDCADRYFI